MATAAQTTNSTGTAQCSVDDFEECEAACYVWAQPLIDTTYIIQCSFGCRTKSAWDKSCVCQLQAYDTAIGTYYTLDSEWAGYYTYNCTDDQGSACECPYFWVGVGEFIGAVVVLAGIVAWIVHCCHKAGHCRRARPLGAPLLQRPVTSVAMGRK